MINRKKLKQLLFFFMFINCCIILSITSISLSTDYWVIARPYRKQPLINPLIDYKTTREYFSSLTSQEDYFLGVSFTDEDSILLPLDLSKSKNGCKRYNGKIRSEWFLIIIYYL